MKFILFITIFITKDGKVIHDWWAERLIYALGLNSAISSQPSPEEYFEILTGRKRIVIKGEELFLKEEKPYIYTYRVSLPSGRFFIVGKAKASSIIKIGDKSFLLKKSERYPEKVGTVVLPKGEYEIVVSSFKKDPIDFLAFDSGCFPPISPLRGWIKGEVLRFGDKASSIVRALNVEELLPQIEYEEVELKTEGDITILEFSIKEKGVYSVLIETEKKRKYESVWTDTCGKYTFLSGPDGRGLLLTMEMEGEYRIYGRNGIKGYLLRRKAEEEEYIRILMRMGFSEKKKEELVSEIEMEDNIRRLEVRAEKKEVPQIPIGAVLLWPEIPMPYRKSVSPLLPEFAE